MAFNPNVEIDYARYDTDERSQHSMHSTGGPKRYAGQSQETAFTQRMSQILDVKPRRIPEIFSNHPYKTVRANPLKIEGDDYDSYVAEMLSDAEIDADPLGWIEGAYVFDVENTAHVQSLKSVQCGAAFIQNPSSYLPVLALDVQPGQKILDMCSAPGGKASFIGALTDNRAELMVNEPKGRRMQRLRDVLKTAGVSAEYSDADGKHLPNLLEGRQFDSIIIDAECSTEAGVNFASRDPLEGWSVERLKRTARLQSGLIRAGFDLLRPGGVLVYSTCTLSPEENEGIVSSLLEYREDAVIEPITFDAEPTLSPMRSWEGKRYRKEVYENVLRVKPGNNLEGFFVARIRKMTGTLAVDSAMIEGISLDEIARKGLRPWQTQQKQ